jgi:hypothetical protein
MAEGDHLQRAIELVRGCGGDQHTIDRVITLIQHEVYMREEDVRTKVRVLLYEFQAMLNEQPNWIKYNDYVDMLNNYRLKFNELGARDLAMCIGALPTKYDGNARDYEQITYMNGVMARMTDIAFQQYGVALQLPIF